MADGCRRVTVVIAMEEEAEPLVQHYRLERLGQACFVPGSPMVAWKGTLANGILLHVVWCGHDERFGVNNVATTAAAVSTYAAVAAFGKPDLMLSAGTAGGFGQRGARVGDVYLSTKCVFHSRRIPVADGTLEEYGFGHFRSPPLFGLAFASGLKQGVISTSDSLDFTPTDMELMMAEGAVVKEMECAAVAWVCEKLRIPFAAIKSITDIVDGEKATRIEFESNLRQASLALQEKLGIVLDLIGGRPLSVWAAIEHKTEPAASVASASHAEFAEMALPNSANTACAIPIQSELNHGSRPQSVRIAVFFGVLTVIVCEAALIALAGRRTFRVRS